MKLASFKKGIQPQDKKSLTNRKSIEILPLPEQVFIPLLQHIGVGGEPCVEKGMEVKTGQVIGKSEKFVSSPVHSSVTGTVANVSTFLHPLGLKTTMVHIKKGENEIWDKLPLYKDWKSTSPEELRKSIWNAGIVGLGGAAFPTHVKLQPPKDKNIDTFILNGVECEPFLTADHRAMLEKGEKILDGMAIIMKILGTDKGYIGIENNKPDAIEYLRKLVKVKYPEFKIIPLKVKYPQGAEKMLIKAIVNRKVPAGGLPMDVGVVVNNVGTALSVAEAILDGKPLIERIVTVSGDAITEPKNLLVRIGSPFKNLIEYCSGLKDNIKQIYMGGPMMGLTQYDLNVPVIKATSGIICNSENTIKTQKSYACIQCGHCVGACPMNLLPTRLASFVSKSKYSESNDLGILNCIECGSCSFACPSRIPLVQWIRVGKLKVNELNRKNVA